MSSWPRFNEARARHQRADNIVAELEEIVFRTIQYAIEHGYRGGKSFIATVKSPVTLLRLQREFMERNRIIKIEVTGFKLMSPPSHGPPNVLGHMLGEKRKDTR